MRNRGTERVVSHVLRLVDRHVDRRRKKAHRALPASADGTESVTTSLTITALSCSESENHVRSLVVESPASASLFVNGMSTCRR